MTVTTAGDTDAIGVRYARLLLRGLGVVARHRWLIVAIPLLAGAVSVVRTLRRPVAYTSVARFMAQGVVARPANNVAAQLGLNVGATGDPTATPEFYTELLKSRPVLQRTVRDTFEIRTGGAPVRETLVQYYGSEGAAIGAVKRGISTDIAPKTGLVTLGVVSSDPDLARQVADALLRQLDEFNRQRRSSRFRSEREFAEARLAEATRDLRASEDALQSFLAENRGGLGRSAELGFTNERLNREVTRRQLVYNSLAQAVEQARIDEIRDTPVITVLESPLPGGPDAKRTRDRALLAMALGLAAAVVLAFVIEWLKASGLERTSEFNQLRALGRESLADLRHPLAAMRRGLGRPGGARGP